MTDFDSWSKESLVMFAKDATERMAKEAWGESHEIFWFNDGGIERFAALVRADERKRSAEAAYEFLDDPFLSGHGYATGCRDAILARSET